MAKGASTSSGARLSQASVLRKLEYAWIGVGVAATASVTVGLMMAFNWVLDKRSTGTVGAAEIFQEPLSGVRWLVRPELRGASGGVMSSTPSTTTPGSRMPVTGKLSIYEAGDWVQALDPLTSRWRPAAVTQVHSDEVMIRYCDEAGQRQRPLEHGKKADQVFKWDVQGESQAKQFGARVPRRAPVNMTAADFRLGEEVMVLDANPADARGRVAGVEGKNVVVRWENQSKDDESFAPEGLWLVNWGPFDRLEPVPASQVPKMIEKGAMGSVGVRYTLGQAVEVIFRGGWVPGEVVGGGVGGDQYAVRLLSTGTRIVMQSVRMRAGMSAEARIAESKRAATMTMMAPSYYRPEDEAEAIFEGQWVPVKVKRVEAGGRIVLYPREAGGQEAGRMFSQVRVPRELVQRRMDERMESSRQAGAGGMGQGGLQGGGIPMGGQSAPQGREALTASDCRVGMLVTVRESGRVSGQWRVARVEGEQVYVALTNSNGMEMARPAEMLTTSRAEGLKPAADYVPGERVYVRWGETNSWSINRVEKVEGDKIILRWGQVAESSQSMRMRGAEDVREMKMDEKK